MTASNMAEEISQQTLLANGHVEVLSNGDFKQNHPSDILQQALDEADGYEQNIQHLSDHSYIHTSKSVLLASESDPAKNLELQFVRNAPDLTSTEDSAGAQPEVGLQNLQFESIGDDDKLQLSNGDSAGGQTTDLELQFVHDGSIADKSIHSASPVGECHGVQSAKDVGPQNLQFGTDRSVPIGLADVVQPEKDSQLQNLQFGQEGNDVSSFQKSSEGSMSLPGIGDVFAEEEVVNGNALVISEAESPPYLESPVLASPAFDLSRLGLPLKQTDAPVGSADNPIQIIQHENAYHSTQLLTQAQLQQISHVLARQRGMHSGGRSVLYDRATHTRIVCRVVRPAELAAGTANRCGVTAARGRGRPKRPEQDGSRLSQEERAERKKQRPRTRSGRISKPPSYMVRDYKRIHHLDFDDEANNSDVGYSDYHVSDEENERLASKTGGLTPGVTTSKQRNYSCRSCNKAYIGRGGLSRHYRLNPTHGSLPEGEDVSTQDENSNSSLASSILSNSGGHASQCQQNVASAVPPAQTFESESPPTSQDTPRQEDSISDKRKSKLREVLRNFTEEEVCEAFLPQLARNVPLWDFFHRKCEQKCEGLQIFEMLKEFEKFLAEMQKAALAYLSPASFQDQRKTIINISSKQIADALSLETGAYFVRDTSDLSQPLAKRQRIEEDVGLPDQILSDPEPFPDGLHLDGSKPFYSTQQQLPPPDFGLAGSSSKDLLHPRRPLEVDGLGELSLVNSLREALKASTSGDVCATMSAGDDRRFETEAPKEDDPPQVLRHLMLPNGQVIAWWSPAGKPDLDLVPGNLVILQNPEESVQVPDDQADNTETDGSHV